MPSMPVLDRRLSACLSECIISRSKGLALALAKRRDASSARLTNAPAPKYTLARVTQRVRARPPFRALGRRERDGLDAARRPAKKIALAAE